MCINTDLHEKIKSTITSLKPNNNNRIIEKGKNDNFFISIIFCRIDKFHIDVKK